MFRGEAAKTKKTRFFFGTGTMEPIAVPGRPVEGVWAGGQSDCVCRR